MTGNSQPSIPTVSSKCTIIQCLTCGAVTNGAGEVISLTIDYIWLLSVAGNEPLTALRSAAESVVVSVTETRQ